MERYETLVTELLALAAEASIRANADAEPGIVPWRVLSENVYGAVLVATDGVLTESDLKSIAQQADSIAVGRI